MHVALAVACSKLMIHVQTTNACGLDHLSRDVTVFSFQLDLYPFEHILF